MRLGIIQAGPVAGAKRAALACDGADGEHNLRAGGKRPAACTKTRLPSQRLLHTVRGVAVNMVRYGSSCLTGQEQPFARDGNNVWRNPSLPQL